MKSIQEIQVAVVTVFKITLDDLKGKENTRAVVLPRQLAMYIAKQLTDLSLPDIGRHFGGKHHTTVMHSIAKIENLRHSDQALEVILQRLLAALESTG